MACGNNSVNKKAAIGIRRRSRDRKLKIVGAIINLNDGSELFQELSNDMEKTFRKIKTFSERHPSFDTSEIGDNQVEELDGETPLQAITTETTTSKMNMAKSIPSAFLSVSFLALDPKNCIMSIIPRICKVIQKNTALPELFNLRFVESRYASDPQLQAIYEMVKRKDPEIQQKLHNINRYYSQLVKDFHVRDNECSMDERQARHTQYPS